MKNTQIAGVPIVDLGQEYLSLKPEINEAIEKVLRSGHYVLGPELQKLESQIAQLSGVKHAVGVNSGTDAIALILKSMGIGGNDEVITSPFTFFATVEAILHVGAKPVFADIDGSTFNLDPKLLPKLITPKTKAIVAIHLYGQTADMNPLLDISRKAGIKTVEDMAQALGANDRGRPAGSMGHAAALSFYPTKNLGACGDGGMVLTNDEKLAQNVRSLRSHGAHVKYRYDQVGYNSRLDELQAAILNVKMKRIYSWTQRRVTLAKLYDKLLKGLPLTTPQIRAQSESVYHLYTIRTLQRNALANFLKSKGIQSGIHYPVPLHLTPALSGLGYKSGDFPESEQAAREVLSLPLHAQMSEGDVEQVADAVKAFFNP